MSGFANQTQSWSALVAECSDMSGIPAVYHDLRQVLGFVLLGAWRRVGHVFVLPQVSSVETEQILVGGVARRRDARFCDLFASRSVPCASRRTRAASTHSDCRKLRPGPGWRQPLP
jgi:hypothetical protein